jgi:predicted ATP-dependent endonuclease of OLD family
MIKLKEITVFKYKSIETPQTFSIEDDVTVLVGMNESGKTSALEALAKTNYFENDDDFRFNLTRDYPRKEKKNIEKQGEYPVAITCIFRIEDKLSRAIDADLGKGVFNEKEFSRSTNYENKHSVEGLPCDFKTFIKNKIKDFGLPVDMNLDALRSKDSQAQLTALINAQPNGEVKAKLEKLKSYLENVYKWTDPIGEYIYRKHIAPNLPKFLYYDEFYALPSRISINKMKSGEIRGEEDKTGKALFELADINIDELLSASDFEDFKAELEATEAIISDELLKYWKTNRNLRIEFEIDRVVNSQQVITDHILDIRVRNDRARVSLPLRNRSKGFNWFFSFLVWFKKIQEDQSSTYVLLLDEPGLNLHASAQADLLEFIEDLSKDYQILYTTHSPFMIDATRLQRVRTVIETKDGSKISDTIQEKDSNTLFPVQAALGYDIAQNLFTTKHSLLVEGASELLYLQVISAYLQTLERTGLDSKVTIIPTGGLDKVSSFISLLRGGNSSTVCLLDTFTDAKGKAKLDNLIEHRVLSQRKIRFIHEFLPDYTAATLEDLFTKEDYLKLYNEAFPDQPVKLSQLNREIQPILTQISEHFDSAEGFNHYRPANKLAARGIDAKSFSKETLDNFEKLFIEINKLF